MMPRRILSSALLGLAVLGACSEANEPTTASSPNLGRAPTSAPPPAPLVSVAAAGSSLTFWPYTGTNFSSTRSDPINLIFVGEADPVSIREALFRLDGNRTAFGFPPVFPFNCTWSDAMGEEQTGYSHADGWEGSVIQLECGAYDPVRFHVRLFKAGDWTIANAHLDVLIPGTPNHQVLSWELAEQLVVADFVRSGLLAAPPMPTQHIHEAPFRTIPAVIYNGLPPELRQLTGGPMGNVTEDVPIQTDGRATILHLGRAVRPRPGATSENLTIRFNQAIPKPFCNAGNEWIFVQGPIQMNQEVQVSASGDFARTWWAGGEVTVTPINPLTGEVLGPTQPGRIRDRSRAQIRGDETALWYSRTLQLRVERGAPERLEVELQVGPFDITRFHYRERCSP